MGLTLGLGGSKRPREAAPSVGGACPRPERWPLTLPTDVPSHPSPSPFEPLWTEATPNSGLGLPAETPATMSDEEV